MKRNKSFLLKQIKKRVSMPNLDIHDLQCFPSCESCGYEYTTQKDVDALVYSRTTASADIYYCAKCQEEEVSIESD